MGRYVERLGEDISWLRAHAMIWARQCQKPSIRSILAAARRAYCPRRLEEDIFHLATGIQGSSKSGGYGRVRAGHAD